MENSFKKIKHILPWLFSSLAFFIPLIIYTITMAPGITMGDAGELIAAASGLGVGHPPGAPTWTILTHFFTKIPISNIAWRVNFASAVYAAGSCLMIFLIVKELLKVEKSWIVELIALSVALTYGFTGTIWVNAVVAEVYALMALFSLLAFYTVILWQKKKQLRFIFSAGLFCSLGFGVHYQVALIFPALAVFVLVDWWKEKNYKTLGKIFLSGFGGLILGLLVFAYLGQSFHTAIFFGSYFKKAVFCQ